MPFSPPGPFLMRIGSLGLLWASTAVSHGQSPRGEIAVSIPSVNFAARSEPILKKILSVNDRVPLAEEKPPLEDTLFPSDSYAVYASHNPVREPSINPARPYPEKPKPSPKDSELVSLAMKVAPAVVSLKAWDRYGSLLSSGAGFFINSEGLVLTDAGFIHPRFSPHIDYVTVKTGAGEKYVIQGAYYRNLRDGVALLQVDAVDTPFLELGTTPDLSEPHSVAVVGVHPTKGLTLNEATMSPDNTGAGAGWLKITGTDTPGAVGSPVFSPDGNVLALVAMQVPLRNWKNYAVTPDPARRILENGSVPVLTPVNELPYQVGTTLKDDPEFIQAIQDLIERRTRRAHSALSKAVLKHPRSAEAWAMLGLANAKLGRDDEAIACHYRAVALDPDVREYWRALSQRLLRSDAGPGDDRVDVLKQNALENPGSYKAQLALAEQSVRAGDLEYARKAIDHARSTPGADPVHLTFLETFIHTREGDAIKAELSLGRFLSENPRHSRGWFLLGVVLESQGRRVDAITAYQRAVKHEPGMIDAWSNLKMAYLKSGDRIRARRAHEMVLKLGN